MQVSKTEEQGMRLVAILAGHRRQMTLAELGRASGLPETTVAKLLAKLRRGLVVLAVRGRRGGYELAEPPEQLRLSQVLRPLGLSVFRGRFCMDNPEPRRPCPRTSDCAIRPVWAQLEEQIEQLLDRITLADLVQTEQGVKAHLAEVWPDTVRKPHNNGTAAVARAPKSNAEGADHR